MNKKAEEKYSLGEVIKDCLVVGTIIKILFDYNVPLSISWIILVIGMFFTLLLGLLRTIIASISFILFIFSFTGKYPKEGALLILVFIAYAILARWTKKKIFA